MSLMCVCLFVCAHKRRSYPRCVMAGIVKWPRRSILQRVEAYILSQLIYVHTPVCYMSVCAQRLCRPGENIEIRGKR
jgi:hypothetical protein